MFDFLHSPSRRRFLGTLATLPALTAFDRRDPDLILHNGNIVTMGGTPRAQAVAITDGRFYAVGSDKEILALATGRTKKTDLGGKTVVPGFIDAHSHPGSSGLSHLREIDCDLRSIKAIQDAVRERAARTPKGEWILGFKYDDTKTQERRFLTIADLDACAPEHPVRIQHRGGHTIYVNSLALKLAGITHETPDPKGGMFDRDPASKNLTGRIKESACDPVERIIPSSYTRDDLREGVKLISKMMTRTGVTSVHDAYGSPEYLRAYQDAYENGDLSMRVYCLIGYTHIRQIGRAHV